MPIQHYRQYAVIGLYAVSFFFFASCQDKKVEIPAPEENRVITEYGSETLTIQDVLVAFQETHSYDELLDAPDAGSAIDNKVERLTPADIINSITRDLLFNAEYARLAINQSLDQTPQYQAYRQNLLKDELYQKLLYEEVLQKVHIEDSDARRFYQENKSSLYLKNNTNIYTIRGILIDIDQWGEEAQKRADTAYQFLNQGHSFESVAVRFSDTEPTKRGKENTLPPGLADPEIESRIAALEDGQFTEPFTHRNQIRIYKREAFIPPDYIPYDEAKKHILQTMITQENDRRITLFTQELIQKFGCITNPDLIKEREVQPDTIILSIPGVYELTFKEFDDYATETRQSTIPEKEHYLSLLALKSVCYAEALDRGWDESDVPATLDYWEKSRLAMLSIRHAVFAEGHASEDELNKLYLERSSAQEVPEILKKPDIYELYHIFFRVPFQTTMAGMEAMARFRQAEEKANQALAMIQEGRPFEDVAASFAKNKNDALSGGFLGWIPYDPNKRLFHDIRELKAGEISKTPLYVNNLSQNRAGYELFYLKSISPGGLRTLDEIKDLVTTSFAQRLLSLKKKEFEERLSEKGSLTCHQEALDQILTYLRFLRDHPQLQIDIFRYTEPPVARDSQ